LNAHSSFISSFFFLTFRRPLTSTLFPYTTLFRSHLVGVYNQWTGQASPLTTTNTHTGPGSCSFSAEPSSSVTSGRRFAPGSSSMTAHTQSPNIWPRHSPHPTTRDRKSVVQGKSAG